MKQYMHWLPSLSALLVLAACGGGGESEAAPAGPVQVATGGSANRGEADAADAAAQAFATLNTERERCGFGTVRRQAALDTAAAWQADYLRRRFEQGLPASHSQNPAASGFQGVSPADRAAKAGYDHAALGEYLSFVPLGRSAGTGDALVRAMLATVYHLAGMLDGNREAGVSVAFADAAAPRFRQAILAWENGTPRGSRPAEPGVLLTYPCAGSSGLQPAMYGESPEPFAGLGFAAGPGTGHPLYLRAPAGSSLRLSAATLISANGRPVTVQLYQAADDPHRMLAMHQAFVIPREPLEAGGTYQAQVQGSIDGVPFSRDFRFGTGL